MVESMCEHCWGEHEPDLSDASLDFKGYRFTPPFLCMCCGRETCVRQWAWGRTCGLCDTGNCDQHSRGFKPEYAHEHPPWGPQATIEQIAEATGATPLTPEQAAT